MIYNYEYILSVLESDIKKGEIDGTELHYLMIHKSAFELDYNQMMDFKNRWDKLEKHFRNLNQSEKI